MEPHEVQQGEVQSPAPGEEQLQAPVHAGESPAGKQLYKKRSAGPDGHQVDHEPAIYPCGQEGQWYPLSCITNVIYCQQVERGDPFLLLSTEFCVQFWALQQKRGMDILEPSPVTGHEDD